MIKTKKGLDLPISGIPSLDVDSSTAINTIAILGADFVGLKPTMMVEEGDIVLAGQKLFENKKIQALILQPHPLELLNLLIEERKEGFSHSSLKLIIRLTQYNLTLVITLVQLNF